MDNEITESSMSASEKMLPQSQVNELIGGAKAAAADKAAREVEAKYQQHIAQLEEKLKSIPDEDALLSKLEQRRQEREKASQDAAEQAALQQQFEEIKAKYNSKLVAAKDIDPEFDTLMTKFPHATHQALVIGTADLPNTGDVMLYMARHPTKAHLLNQTASSNWEGFMSELKEISDTLQSQKASTNAKVKPPLSKLKSDVVGLNNSGKRTLADIKASARTDKSLRL